MTETNLVVPMKFDETYFFIIYTNPVDAAKVALAMAETSSGC